MSFIKPPCFRSSDRRRMSVFAAMRRPRTHRRAYSDTDRPEISAFVLNSRSSSSVTRILTLPVSATLSPPSFWGPGATPLASTPCGAQARHERRTDRAADCVRAFGLGPPRSGVRMTNACLSPVLEKFSRPSKARLGNYMPQSTGDNFKCYRSAIAKTTLEKGQG